MSKSMSDKRNEEKGVCLTWQLLTLLWYADAGFRPVSENGRSRMFTMEEVRAGLATPQSVYQEIEPGDRRPSDKKLTARFAPPRGPRAVSSWLPSQK